MKHVFTQDEITVMEYTIEDLLDMKRTTRCYFIFPVMLNTTGDDDLSLYESIVNFTQGHKEAIYIYSILLYAGKVKFRTNLMYDPSTLEFLL